LDVNAGVESIFDDEIFVRNRRLFVADTQGKACLEKLMDRLRVSPDIAALPCDPIVIRRKGKASVIVRTLPVHGAVRTPFLGARALLTLTVIEPRSGQKVTLLSKAFGLSPAEARLASTIAEGIDPERAAQELGISRETVRSQLKAVFAKAETHRQSELVALLSRL
jgi:DNA-binding CsgD family transcriptional regulator